MIRAAINSAETERCEFCATRRAGATAVVAVINFVAGPETVSVFDRSVDPSLRRSSSSACRTVATVEAVGGSVATLVT